MNSNKKKVLNVGGNTRDIPLPDIYDNWQQLLLDIDPTSKPDFVADARDLFHITEKFDSIYCSHTLEHFFPHDVPKVLKGFHHLLLPNGFVFLRVPDLSQVIKQVYEKNLALDETIYTSPAGPITPLDVIYGYHVEIERSGQDWFAHKIGYSETLMKKYLKEADFEANIIKADLELIAVGRKII